MEFDNDVKVDVVFKRYLNKTSTSTNKSYFEEREAPPSYIPVYPNLQLYSEYHAVTPDVPTDILHLGEQDTDDMGQVLKSSYVGRTSEINRIIRKYVNVPLIPVPTPQGKAFMAPKCISMQTTAGFAAGEVISGISSGARAVVVKIIDTFVFYKFACGGLLDFAKGETVKGQTTGYTDLVVQDGKTCKFSRVLQAVIPYDFGNGGYNTKLYKADGTQIYFGEGNWLLDNYSGVLTFYGNLPSGVSASLPPGITFYRYVGNIGLNFTNTSQGFVGIGTNCPQVSLDLGTTDALHIPTGTTAERPVNPQSGYIRFNTDLNTTECWNGSIWSDLEKGTGNGSDPVNISTGGGDRLTTIGNSTGASEIQMLAGTGNIALRNSGGIVLDAASNITASTRGPGPSSINFGSDVDDLTINFVATGSRSKINFFGPTNIETRSVHTGDLFVGGTLSADAQDNIWTIDVDPDSSGTSTNLVFKKMIAGTFVTRFMIT